MMLERSGELAGLATSALWVVSSLAFASAGRSLGATRLNLWRSVLAALILLTGQFCLYGNLFPNMGAERSWYLCVSGLLGLAIGDQFLFAGYVLVGPRTMTLLLTLAPAVAASLSWIVFGQAMMAQAIFGMVVTLAGVMWVAAERPHPASLISPAQRTRGIWFGVGAAICQGVGMVLASNGLRGDVDAFSALTLRMSAGAVGIIAIAMVVGRSQRARPVNEGSTRPIVQVASFASILSLIIGTITGPILGVGCSLYALQKLEVGVATTLMSLVPVMILPVTRVTEGRWPSARAVLGAFIAVAGVALLATAPRAQAV